MKKIAILFNDCGFSKINLTSIPNGNPGIGGTHYEFALLIYYLSRDSNYSITVFHISDNILPNNVINIKCESIEEAISKISSNSFDYVIIQNNLCKLVNSESKSKYIVWAHNYPSIFEVIKMNKQNNIHMVVCVGKTIFKFCRFFTKKAVLINNMVSPSIVVKEKKERNNCIAFLGSLTLGKSFHCLAKIWPKIKKRYPELKLLVIGSGNLYDKKRKLGQYGLALESYEKRFIKYLLNSDGSLDSSVLFMGDVGIEKYEIISNCLVGIVNPTGRTETFGLTAIEFNLCSVFAIGCVPSIQNKKNGYITYKGFGLYRKICKCLDNKTYTIRKGLESREYATQFFPDRILVNWKKILI